MGISARKTLHLFHCIQYFVLSVFTVPRSNCSVDLWQLHSGIRNGSSNLNCARAAAEEIYTSCINTWCIKLCSRMLRETDRFHFFTSQGLVGLLLLNIATSHQPCRCGNPICREARCIVVPRFQCTIELNHVVYDWSLQS